ncbi:hypothetical protein JCM3770_007407 [Rhodotorula araucariae]
MCAKTLLLAAALAAMASSISAHSIVTSVWVNGRDTTDADVGAASYMRTPTSSDPIKDLHSPSLACNDNGFHAVSGFLSVAPGDKIEPEWYHEGARGEDPIADSHVGPITTWISPLEANTKGHVWVQIASEAYWKTSRMWAVEKMIANRGRHTVRVPSDLAPGKYLMRFEITALHEAWKAGGAQFYPNCAQVEVTGDGKTALPAGVAIPGFFAKSTPGIVWDVYYSDTYNATLDYVAPGTGVWIGNSSSYSTTACKEVVYGLVPAGFCQPDAATPITTVSETSTSETSTSKSEATSTSQGSTTSEAAPTSMSATTSASSSSSPSQSSSSSGGYSHTTTTTSSTGCPSFTGYNARHKHCHNPDSGSAADFSKNHSSYVGTRTRKMRKCRADHDHN